MQASARLAVRALGLSAAFGARVAGAEPGAGEPPPAPHPEVANGLLMRRGIGLDLDASAGVRIRHGDGDDTRWWCARARVGVLLYDEPSFWSLGVAGQLGPLDSAALGVELQYFEVFHGASAQVGVFPVDTAGGTSITAQLGVALFDLQYQRRLSGARSGDQALVVLVDIPLGVIHQMRADPPGVVHR